jgi:amino acid permease
VSVMSLLGGDFVKRHHPKRVFYFVTIAIILINWAVAVSVASINVILGVAGALSTVPIALLLPGKYLAALSAPGPAGKADRLKGRVAMWAGVCLTVVCLYGSLAVGP